MRRRSGSGIRVKIASRYLLRSHVGPFVFALGALTGLQLVQQVAKRFGDLVGKGLPWSVIGELFGLSLPFIVAETLPMAVLVAVLYTMSRLAADNEITAMRAGGMSLWRILRPLLLAGIGVAVVAFAFNDHVLPRANHRLRSLYTAIARKKPTFSLKEQVINEVQRNRFFLRAARIDPATFALRDVTIYDLADQDRRRVIYADSGALAITANQEDAELTLYDGVIHEFDRSDPRMFQQIKFRQDRIRVEGVGNELQRTLTDSYKGQREMSICEMDRAVRAAHHERRLALRDAATTRLNALRAVLSLPPVPTDTVIASDRPSLYCRFLAHAAAWLLPPELRAQGRPPQARGGPRDSLNPEILRRLNPPARATLLTGRPPLARSNDIQADMERAQGASIRAAHYLVEIHKKYAIATASIIFVLIGVPLALSFPRGGVGLVIGASLVIFAVYYIGLIGGEALASRGRVSPTIMWAPNVIFGLIGLALLARTRRGARARRTAS